MSMRMKTIILISLIVFITTAANFFSSLYFTGSSLEKTIEQDLAFAIGIADRLVGTKMNLMKSEAAAVALRLAAAGSGQEQKQLMAEQFDKYPDISALSIFDRNGVMASYSVPPHDHDLNLHAAYLEMVYGGATIISSPFYCDVRKEYVMNVYTPMRSGAILAVTMPGQTFSDMLSEQRLWQTGNIFMLNEVGMFIGATNQETILAMNNYVLNNKNGAGGAGEPDEEIGGLVRKILSSDRGVERYTFDGVENMCAHSRIDGSVLGWRVAVTVPLDASPRADAMRGSLYAAVLFLIIGVAAAFFLSRVTSQPFKKIELQNSELAELNRTIQAQAEATRDFLAHMSHEIRTPLNAVIGLSELTLGSGLLSLEAESNLEKINGAGATILSIVNDILDISKIESGRFDLSPIRYDTPSLINDTVTLNIVRIDGKPVEFKIYVDENLPGALYGDDLRVKQIFNNLLSNAFKYTHSGTVEWRVSFERDEDNEDNVWLVSSIRDTGVGIKPEDVQKLFSVYNQVDTKRNRAVEGTGLGLAITKRLLEMMDGSITVESEYGKGSVFHIRLSQTLASAAPIGKEVAENLMHMRLPAAKRNRNTKLVRVNLSYAHVLVVDDIMTNMDVVKGMMKPYGLQVDCAVSGPQAIEMIRAGSPRYSAVFMDHMMPGMDGVEATRIIREEIGTDYAREVPVIALTANAILGNEEMFLSQGFQAFISKPIDMMKLDFVLRQWVRDKKLEPEQKLRSSGEPGLESESRTENQNDNRFSALYGITGINADSALSRFEGDGAVLIDVLRSYAANTPPLLSGLRQYLAAGNLADYAITVHGVKGSSYTIAAMDAGRAAEALETAAKAGDIGAVKAGHPVLEKAAEALFDEIRRVLDVLDKTDRSVKPGAAEPDPSLLAELRGACEAFDMDRIDSIMETLSSFQYERGGELVAWLRERVTKMAFEEIAAGRWPGASSIR